MASSLHSRIIVGFFVLSLSFIVLFSTPGVTAKSRSPSHDRNSHVTFECKNVPTDNEHRHHDADANDSNVVSALLPGLDMLLSMVGSGHASLSLRQDWRTQLSTAQASVGFGAVRFHGILDDDMSTFLNGEANMVNVFSSLDYMVNEAHMTPFIELSFMPEELALHPNETIFHYKGIISQPANFTQWGDFIEEFVSLIVSRYGLAEVEQWKFEVWNEPNCGFLAPTDGCCQTCGPFRLYLELYNATARAVKRVSPQLQVGGPATAQTGSLSNFTAFLQSSGAPADFISTHLYPTDTIVPTTRIGFAETVAAAANIAADAGLPLVLSEFNSGLGIGVADTSYSAAFVISQMVLFHNVSNVDTLSFWTFSDIFEEQGFLSPPFSDSFGMIDVYGVAKPVFRAFEMMGMLRTTIETGESSTLLLVQSEGTIDTVVVSTQTGTASDATAPGTRSAVSSSAQQTKAAAAATSRSLITAIVTNFDGHGTRINTTDVTLRFSNLTNPSGVLLSPITQDSANPILTWQSLGSPVYPTPFQVQEMQAASQINTTTTVVVAGAQPGVYTLDLVLAPYDTVMETFQCG
eukprot:TRINITY_DN7082_c0_g1_i2.p1 TRINITY_DN7082_c0_g1~~TRINITY_DN7082_c0_g1_i2.p1  ORF type:complete len:577 (-),score=114.55 TRINITY_DN7082_c0_g1_i2:41-1771(-)